jgi:hypothetical protein
MASVWIISYVLNFLEFSDFSAVHSFFILFKGELSEMFYLKNSEFNIIICKIKLPTD